MATDAGLRARAAAEEIVARYHQIQAYIERPAVAARVVRFACGRESAGSFGRPAVRAFRRRHPAVGLRVVTLRTRERLAQVASGAADFATISVEPAQAERLVGGPLYAERLADDPLVAAAAPSFPDAKAFADRRGPVTADELVHFPLVLPEPGAAMREEFDRRLVAAGVWDRLTVAVEVGGWGSILDFVRDGLGVAVAPRSAALSRRLLVRPLADGLAPPNVLHLVARSGGKAADGMPAPDVSDAARGFWAAVKEAATRHTAKP